MNAGYFGSRSEEIKAFLRSHLEACVEEFSFLNRWGKDLPARIGAFARGGKFIRGGLVFLGHELAGGRPGETTLRIAAAIELLHSAFLIHDDIMDQDRMRRGMPSVFWQFREEAHAKGIEESEHYGTSMGICAGDCALFIALRLISSADIPDGVKDLVCRESYAIGLAQMADIDYGTFSRIPSEKEIIDLYLWKTARYSFSLPLSAGAMAGNADEELVSALWRLGESMGIMFQMRDDELGIFGSENAIGKPVGSDIRLAKKTLLIAIALKRLDPVSRSELTGILGRRDATADEILRARRLIETSGARSELISRMNALAAETGTMIDALVAPEDSKEHLRSLVDFIRTRDR